MKVILVVVALVAGGCSPSPRTTAVTDTPERPGAEARFPRPGTAIVEVTGAVEFAKTGSGSACGFGKRISSHDLEGFFVQPAWAFSLNADRTHAGQAIARLTINDTTYEWTGDGETFKPHDGPQDLTFDGVLRSNAGATIRAKVHITCPHYPTAVVPRPVRAILAKHSGVEPRAYSTFDFGRERYSAAASVVLPRDLAFKALASVRSDLPAGYVAFVGTEQFLGDEQHADGSVELVIAPGADQFDIVRSARTDAVNYDILTEGVIKQLAVWDRHHGIDIVMANTDSLMFKLRSRPANLMAFAQEVEALCPDAVSGELDTLPALANEIGARGEVWLWWD